MRVLASDTWPVRGSLGDLLSAARTEVIPELWNKAFNPDDLSWLPRLIAVEVPRTYSISSHSDELLPSSLDLTVSRVNHSVFPALLLSGSRREVCAGVSSGFLNPHPEEELIISETPGFGDVEDIVRPHHCYVPLLKSGGLSS